LGAALADAMSLGGGWHQRQRTWSRWAVAQSLDLVAELCLIQLGRGAGYALLIRVLANITKATFHKEGWVIFARNGFVVA
jgi:hypothetical protein